MTNKYPCFVIGYHGCDKKVCDNIITGGTFKKSVNAYDWLGNGVYFWENDEIRALEWAKEQANRGKIETPAVVGAIIDLGNCLDFTERESIKLLKTGFSLLELRSKLLGINLPTNHTANDFGDILLRERDCAVIQQIHELSRSGLVEGLKPYDTVRGVFSEGKEAYPGSSFMEKTHTQICVVNTDNIIGCFLPRKRKRSL